MVKIVAIDETGEIASEIELLDEKDRPTRALAGLVALELAVDALIAFGIFKALKKVRG